ncbi:response regulator [Dethiothermospora halolimnae]|uniref:response regulator n=1 Tax=Dethiothermospora halolimnae TaxID=3114390 RepID=UPI003CCBDB69
MDILIVEDDINIIMILEKIVKERNLGNVIDYVQDGSLAKERINTLNPNVVLVDVLMPGKDGITLVEEVKKENPDIQFIMISQVTSKDMIGKAYEKGVEYYVTKPINAVEIESVIKKVKEKINISSTLNKIQNLIGDNSKKDTVNKENYEVKIKRIMHNIGIMGEAGSKDIINITKYLLETEKSISNITMKELLKKFSDNPKSMEQRLRRAAKNGMTNIANLGIEDYMNEYFIEYSNGLYNFEQVKAEMDYIRDKSSKKGKVNLKKFIDSMVFYCKR